MMNVTEAIHCIGCGIELGLMPIPLPRSQEVYCPRCKTKPLDAFSNDGETFYDCGHCGGQFVSNDVLAVLISRHQSNLVDLPKRLQPNNPLLDQVTYLPCPFCKDLMIRRNFGRLSGIIVDVCNHHGTWFDVGELPRILAFVGKGGLQRTQAAETAEKKWTSGQMHAISSDPSVSAWTFDAPSTSSKISLADMEEATVAFIHWVTDMLR
jgi:Zn-finger nucleic acid-binding protein